MPFNSNHSRFGPQAPSPKQIRCEFRKALLRDFRFLRHRWQTDDMAYIAATEKYGRDLLRRWEKRLETDYGLRRETNEDGQTIFRWGEGAQDWFTFYTESTFKRDLDQNADLAFLTPARYSERACKAGGQRSGAIRYEKNADKRAKAVQMDKAGRSCREIAKALDVAPSTVSRWLRGLRFEERDGKPRHVLHEGIVQSIPRLNEPPALAHPGSCNTPETPKNPIRDRDLFKDAGGCLRFYERDGMLDDPGSCNTPIERSLLAAQRDIPAIADYQDGHSQEVVQLTLFDMSGAMATTEP